MSVRQSVCSRRLSCNCDVATYGGGRGNYSDNIHSVNVNMDELPKQQVQLIKKKTNKKNKFTSWVGFTSFTFYR